MKIKTNIFLSGAIIVLLCILFLPTFNQWARRFTAADSYYSHGFLVPFVSLFLVWQKKGRIKELLPQHTPCNAGLVLLAGGLLLHLVSSFLEVNFGSYFAFVIIVTGLVLYLLGTTITKELFFPLFFLLFMVPLPSVVIIAISFKMKIFAAQASTFLADAMGIEVVREGSTIHTPNGSLMVGDPCSGLRSLISLLALGALFTQLVSIPRVKKVILFLSAVPIALFSNILRIILLVVVTYFYGEKTALGLFEKFVGFLVFIFAFIGLNLVVKLLKWRELIPT